MSRANLLCIMMIALFCAGGAGWRAQAQVIDYITGFSFGSLDFSTSFSVTLQLGTNGALDVSGFGVVSNGGENAGHIRITSPDTGMIDVRCTSQAVLAHPTASPITIQNIEIAVNTGVVFGGGNQCNGVGIGDLPAATIDMDAIPDPDVYIGGEIVISSPIILPSNDVYNTSGDGTPVTISLIIQ